MEPANQLLPFPKRPKVSIKFLSKPIKLVSNHFTLSLATKQPSIYLYDIKILDTEKDELIQADARIQRQAIIKTALQKIREAFGMNFWHSGQLLWSLKNYSSPKTIETTQESKHYAIVMTKAKEINLKPETFQDNKVAAQALQYLNILIKRYFMEKNFQEWGMNAKFYDPNQVNSIPEFFLEIYTGYKTSCQTYMNYTPKVLIDFASKIVRSDNVLYYIKEAKSNEEAKDMIRGRSVIASYGNFRMWRIDDIDYTSTPKKQIDVDQSGKKSTIADYYKNKYGLQIKDLAQPLLVSKDKKTGKVSLLVPELVQMTGLDDEMRKDFRLMTEVAKYTRLNPNQRMDQIRSLSAPLADYFSKQYGITMNQESTVEGNVLPTPKLTLGNKSFIPDRGNYQLRDPVFRPATFDKWIFVYSEACSQDASSFLETLENCAGAYAITLKKPVKVPIKDKSPEALKEAIRSRVKADTQIVVCMYPPIAKKHWYKALKDVCSKEIGVPCQAVISASLKKNSMSVCSKILLQMNAKVGLELWLTERPVGLPEKTMLIGADVYHNTKIGQERKSCVGFCASLNPEFNKFFSKVTFQNKIGQEIMTGIGALVKEAVLKYFAFNGKKFLPEYIVFFRDGVGENQLRAILDIETKAILTQLKTIDPNYNVKFAEIVVTKRIDDRIFSMDGGPKGGKGVFNPPAGTVVADTVVSNNFDYLLVSQNVTQGTCTPTHYNVIYDTTGLSQDMFWQLSYSQCYNYYNWNGSVRVPAPVQYAHKLAYLVGQTVQGEPEKKLDNKLYYL